MNKETQPDSTKHPRPFVVTDNKYYAAAFPTYDEAHRHLQWKKDHGVIDGDQIYFIDELPEVEKSQDICPAADVQGYDPNV